MPAAKKSNSAASSRPRGRPSTKKIVKSSEFIDDEADEAWVIVLFYNTCPVQLLTSQHE